MTRHLLMDPAFPDLVAAAARDDWRNPRPRHAEPMPQSIADEIRRMLSRLW